MMTLRLVQPERSVHVSVCVRARVCARERFQVRRDAGKSPSGHPLWTKGSLPGEPPPPPGSPGQVVISPLAQQPPASRCGLCRASEDLHLHQEKKAPDPNTNEALPGFWGAPESWRSSAGVRRPPCSRPCTIHDVLPFLGHEHARQPFWDTPEFTLRLSLLTRLRCRS